ISPSANPFCIGGSVTFTATPTNGGTPPAYQWKVNGVNAGINSSTFTYNPVSGDLVTCVMNSSIACPTGNPAASNTITMIGNTGLPAGVSITANPNPFCPGTSVTFTATPNNGGSNPSYQWKVNGLNTGTNSSIFSYNPVTGDKVTCLMTSNLACVSGNPALSNEITLSGTLAPIVSFTTCFDTVTTVNAKPIKLKGGIPLNGTYTGPGVSANTFNPAVAGIGNKTITYTYTNAILCSSSKTKTIIVQAIPAFTCGNNLTDIRDGKIYPTVKIGSQCWFATNLNFGNQVSSTQHQRDNCVNEKYCYQDLSANCNVQGANYQWDEIMLYDDTPGLQGLCPPAWHVPTEAEWNTLFAVYTNNGFAGSPLKYSGYSGFNALLSGVNHFNRQWDFQNFATFFWSSTAYGPYKAWSHGMNDYNPSVSIYPSSRANAFSIRCLKD
ncbi:MAG: FISUMP domain-containing protein, partial [Bacteroidota bacterium]